MFEYLTINEPNIAPIGNLNRNIEIAKVDVIKEIYKKEKIDY